MPSGWPWKGEQPTDPEPETYRGTMSYVCRSGAPAEGLNDQPASPDIRLVPPRADEIHALARQEMVLGGVLALRSRRSMQPAEKANAAPRLLRTGGALFRTGSCGGGR